MADILNQYLPNACQKHRSFNQFASYDSIKSILLEHSGSATAVIVTSTSQYWVNITLVLLQSGLKFITMSSPLLTCFIKPHNATHRTCTPGNIRWGAGWLDSQTSSHT
jgi:hypothetical protein